MKKYKGAVRGRGKKTNKETNKQTSKNIKKGELEILFKSIFRFFIHIHFFSGTHLVLEFVLQEMTLCVEEGHNTSTCL